MRIIVVNDYGSVTGGAAKVAISSINSLAEAGQDVTFLSGVMPIDTSINQDKVRVINFGLNDLQGAPYKISASMSGIWNYRNARLFGRLLEEYDSNHTVIHVHGWLKSLSSSIIREALGRRFKVIISLHDYSAVCPNGGFYNYQTQSHCLLSPLSSKCILENCDSRSYFYKLWRVGRQLVQKHFAGIPSDIVYYISVSDYSESIIKKFLHPSSKIFKIRNPIDIEKMQISKNTLTDQFTFVGRLSPEKGCSLFAAAASKANVRSVFVGSGQEEKKILLINEYSEIKGWCNRSEVINNILLSRAIVYPSLLHETQGLAVLEAAALGIPAIVSDGCAARDLIEDGVTGFLFKHGSIDDLSRKISLLKNDPNISFTMGQAAYNRYWENPCTLERHAKELIKCYSEILYDSQ